MIAEKIKNLREKQHMTQSTLAKEPGFTRSCVNAWELGIPALSTQYIVALSGFFHVSSNYLLI